MAEFIAPNDATWARGQRRWATPRATAARFDRRRGEVTVRLDSGAAFAFDPRRTRELARATDDDLTGVRIEGTGSTLHFPRLDADYSVAGLLEAFVGPLEWTRREARAAASRRNGAKGGRPRKPASAVVAAG